MTSPTPSEPRTGQQLYHSAPLTLGPAAALTAIALGTLYLVQIVLSQLGTLDLVTSMVADAAVIALILAYARHRGMHLADLGLCRARPRFIAAGLLIGIAMWFLTSLIVDLIKPPGDTRGLQQLVTESPLAFTLIALALFPAVAEELVFRGVLTRALALRYRANTAILIGAAVFGVYHLFPPQMVANLVFGIVLGFIALQAGSIVPSMVVHLLNNTMAVLLARDEVPGLVPWIQSHGVVTLIISLVCVSGGLALAAKGVA